MKQIYPTSFLTLLFVLMLGTGVRAQTVLSIMDFEGGIPEMTVTPDATAFYDGGSSRFYGIHNGNGATDDGTLDDTGIANPGRVANVAVAPIGGDVLFYNDLNNTTSSPPTGTSGFAEITFGTVDVSTATAPFFSFDYNIFGFDSNDDVEYYLIEDGVALPTVVLMDGASNASDDGRVTEAITSGTGAVSLVLRVRQNGTGDYAAFDNFQVTDGMPAPPCTISSLGPVSATTCLATTPADNADAVSLTIPYTGVDAATVIELTVDGTPVASFVNDGDDPNADQDGNLTISAAALTEGSTYEVKLAGNCDFSVSGTVAADACEASCDLSTDISMLRLLCSTLTNGTDALVGSLDYDGIEPGAVATISGGTIIANPGNPGTVEDGEINFGPLTEGGSYTITISGGDCSGNESIIIPFSVPSDFCTPSDLVINEVLPNPTGGVDVNKDGFTNSDDEFVELYNAGTSDLNLTDYTLEDFAGIRHTFAPGTILGPGDGIIVIADTIVENGVPLLTPEDYGCQWVEATVTFIGLNNTGTDGVIIRDAAGGIVAQMSYTDAPVGESLALSPDGDLSGGYQNHSVVSSSGAQSSPCSENVDNSVTLPVELVSFTAAAADKSVVLNWATENEVANDRFVIERSENGVRWEQLGSVRAAGRSNGDYSFTDAHPLDGTNLYRLRQIDLDGSFAIYGPVAVTFEASELSVYPNPAGDVLRFNRSLDGASEVLLYDGSGRQLGRLNLTGRGADVQDLQPGVYLLRVRTGNEVETVRFMKR